MSDLSGEAFKAAEVANRYVHRPPYAAQIYAALADNAPATARLLDLGAGEGKIARPMAHVFDHVVAVDPSAAMIALGRSLDNGQAPNITWIEARAEDAPLQGRFDMVTFASSIHWMAPGPLFARLRPHLPPHHTLAFIAGDEPFEPPWHDAWQAFLATWVPKITGRPLGGSAWRASRDRHLDHVQVIDTNSFVSAPFQHTVDGFIQCQLSRNTFALASLGAHAPAFHDQLRALLAPYQDDAGGAAARAGVVILIRTPRDALRGPCGPEPRSQISARGPRGKRRGRQRHIR